MPHDLVGEHGADVNFTFADTDETASGDADSFVMETGSRFHAAPDTL